MTNDDFFVTSLYIDPYFLFKFIFSCLLFIVQYDLIYMH